MPDLTMCRDRECVIRHRCYRYLAEPTARQSYFAETPWKDGECERYWSVGDRMRGVRSLEESDGANKIMEDVKS